jgi:hypothetical protein
MKIQMPHLVDKSLNRSVVTNYQTTLIGSSTMKRVASGFWLYPMTLSVAILTWIFFNVIDQRLFFSPFLAFYIPKDGLFDFVLTTIMAALFAFILSKSIQYFAFRESYLKYNGIRSTSTSVLPAVLVTFSSGCASCSLSIGTFAMSLVGSSGAILLNFLELYQTPINLLSTGLLILSYFILSKNHRQATCNIKTITRV